MANRDLNRIRRDLHRAVETQAILGRHLQETDRAVERLRQEFALASIRRERTRLRGPGGGEAIEFSIDQVVRRKSPKPGEEGSTGIVRRITDPNGGTFIIGRDTADNEDLILVKFDDRKTSGNYKRKNLLPANRSN